MGVNVGVAVGPEGVAVGAAVGGGKVPATQLFALAKRVRNAAIYDFNLAIPALFFFGVALSFLFKVEICLLVILVRALSATNFLERSSNIWRAWHVYRPPESRTC